MFLAGEPAQYREAKIQKWLHTEPSIALLVAAVHVEWTVCRAVLFLSPRPNREIRKELAVVYGLEKYKDCWRMEIVSLRGGHSLPRIVGAWKAVTDALKARDRLVHGRDQYTRHMAAPHVEARLKAAAELRAYGKRLGVDFQARLPIRKKISEQSNQGMVAPRKPDTRGLGDSSGNAWS